LVSTTIRATTDNILLFDDEFRFNDGTPQRNHCWRSLAVVSFVVLPGLGAQGPGGSVVAAKVSDRIAALQAEATPRRSARRYTNGLSNGLKAGTPETGASQSELCHI
jgi:hypothetical protein